MPSVSLLNDQFSHNFQYVLALTRYEFDSKAPMLLALNSLVTGTNAPTAAILLLTLFILVELGGGGGARQPRSGRRPPEGPMDKFKIA